jgi:hypothetical protein
MRPKEFWGLAERDRVTLRQVIDLRLTLVFECRNCKHIAQSDWWNISAPTLPWAPSAGPGNAAGASTGMPNY